MAKLEFSANEATVHKAIVVSLDLAGFSNFCNQPNASFFVPRLAKHFFDALNCQFKEQSGVPWTFLEAAAREEDEKRLPQPNFLKFTGDGALLFWLLENNKDDLPQVFCDRIVKVMRDFQTEIAHRMPEWEKQWRVHKLPKAVRVGVSTGTVFALRPPHTFTRSTEPCDFVGYCVNLAVRLQSHCRQLGFLVHGDLHPTLPGMSFAEALKMQGCQTEPVAYFAQDAGRVPPAEFRKKFRPRD